MALSISQWERQTLLVKAMGSPATWLISLKPPLVRGSYFVRSVPLVEVGPLRQLPAPTARTIRSQLARIRSEEHTSELQSLMRISYAVLCLKKKNKISVYNV